MSSLNKLAEAYITHIDDAISSIKKITQNLTYEQYLNDEVKQLALQKLLENIGEACRFACKHDPSAKNKYPEFPFKGWIGLKNVLNHGYFLIDHDEVWGTLKNDVPALAVKLAEFFPDLIKSQAQKTTQQGDSIDVGALTHGAGLPTAKFSKVVEELKQEKDTKKDIEPDIK